MATVSHYNVAPVIDIYGSVSGRDLGGVSRDINQIIDGMRHAAAAWLARRCPWAGADDEVLLHRTAEWPGFLDHAGLSADRGQLPVMARSFHHDLGVAGGTRWNCLVPVCDAHNPQRARADGSHHVHGRGYIEQHFGRELCDGTNGAKARDAVEAALEAGFTRFRPVLMTALAMIIGMVPMALGLGDGGEQNAPLGRAVIGGLFFATVSTLLFVPTFFSVLQGRRATQGESRN